jgi:hypothetical protein
MIQDQFFLVLVDLRHFSENDITFAFNGSIFHLGVEKNVGNDFYRLANILLEDLGKVSSLFTRSVGVPVLVSIRRGL